MPKRWPEQTTLSCFLSSYAICGVHTVYVRLEAVIIIIIIIIIITASTMVDAGLVAVWLRLGRRFAIASRTKYNLTQMSVDRSK